MTQSLYTRAAIYKDRLIAQRTSDTKHGKGDAAGHQVTRANRQAHIRYPRKDKGDATYHQRYVQQPAMSLTPNVTKDSQLIRHLL